MPETEKFDFLVIGSGPAGEKGAAQAAYFGKRVAIVERWAEPGGVSVHTGTLPSKTLREAALYLTGFQRRELYGMTLRLDRKKSIRQLVGRLRDVIERQTRQIRRNLERHRIELILGTARFLDAHTLGVYAQDGTETRRLEAPVILIAVGSSPLPPRGLSFADPDVEDSDQLLDLDRIPDTMAVVGGGVIGCEYASIFAALGTRVTLIEGRDRVLGFLDSELSSAFKIALERMGGEVLLGDAVEHISREPGLATNALRLALKSGRILKADKMLFSAGRQGNTRGLDLEKAGVLYDERGKINVNGNFETNVPGIYAAGDVIGFPALAATSMDQGRVAARRAFGVGMAASIAELFPYGVYTIPEISMIGATEDELKAKGTPYEVGRSRYENNARGQITGDPDGFVKLIFDPETRKILGAHVLGGAASELVHIPQMLMMKDGRLDDFLQAVFNFPTLAECFKYAAYDGLQRLAHKAGGAPIEMAASEASKGAKVQTSPGGRAWFLGVALEDPEALETRPVSIAAMDRWRRVRFRTWTFSPSGDGIVSPDIAEDGFVIAVDGPMALPGAGHKVREAMKHLTQSGKFGKPSGKSARTSSTLPGSVLLFSNLRNAGFGVLGEAPWESTMLLEVNLDHLWGQWAGHTMPKKTLPSGRRARYDLLRGLGIELAHGPDAVTHDQLDAAAAAFAAYLWATGKAKEYGDAPVFDETRGCFTEGRVVSL